MSQDLKSALNQIPSASKKKDVIIWWIISSSMILFAWIGIVLQGLGIIYFSILGEGIITVVLLIGGICIGLIALVKTYSLVTRKIFFWIPVLSVLILLIVAIVIQWNKKLLEEKRRTETIQTFNEKWDKIK